MKRILCGSVVAAAVVMAAGCASRSDVAKPQTQDNFGVRMAKQNLWREAMFRFRRAVEINPSDAMAHNNLAVAYEANGDFDAARSEEHTSELQSLRHLVCRLLLEKKKKKHKTS